MCICQCKESNWSVADDANGTVHGDSDDCCNDTDYGYVGEGHDAYCYSNDVEGCDSDNWRKWMESLGKLICMNISIHAN